MHGTWYISMVFQAKIVKIKFTVAENKDQITKKNTQFTENNLVISQVLKIRQ